MVADKDVGDDELDRAAERGRSGEPEAPLSNYIAIPIKNKIFLQRLDEVSWFEANGKYVRVHIGSRAPLIRTRMRILESRLDGDKFLRVNRSAIVNIDHIAHLERWFQQTWVITLTDSTSIRSGRGFSAAIQKLIDTYY
jgi:two-component system LytT family response regulator